MTSKRANPRSVRTGYKLEVTEADIQKSIKMHSAKCVVATAIARQISDATSISVDLQTIRFSRPAERKRLVYLTPPEVVDYVVDFDAGDEIEPFWFVLAHPAYVQEMQVHREGNRTIRTNARTTEYPLQVEARHKIETVSKTSKANQKSPIPRMRIRSYGRRDLRINRDRDQVERGEVEAYSGSGPTMSN